MVDNQGNISKLNNFFGDLKIGVSRKRFKIKFNQSMFNNPENDPRLYGNKISLIRIFQKFLKEYLQHAKRERNVRPGKLEQKKSSMIKTKNN